MFRGPSGSMQGCFRVDPGLIQDRFGTYSGSLWNRFGIDSGSIQDQFETDLESIWDRFGIDLGLIWDQFEVDSGLIRDLGSMQHRLGINLGLDGHWMVIRWPSDGFVFNQCRTCTIIYQVICLRGFVGTLMLFQTVFSLFAQLFFLGGLSGVGGPLPFPRHPMGLHPKDAPKVSPGQASPNYDFSGKKHWARNVECFVACFSLFRAQGFNFLMCFSHFPQVCDIYNDKDRQRR